MRRNIKKILAGATGLEPATSAVTGQRPRGSSPAISSRDSTPHHDNSDLKNHDSTLELKQKSRNAPALIGAFLTAALYALTACASLPPIDANGNNVVSAP